MIADGEFLEWADVFGNYYGTGAADTEAALARARTWCSSSTCRARAAGAEPRHRARSAIFVLPPSFEVLEQRLRGRSKDSEEQIQRRLAVARREVAEYAQYDYVVINDELDDGGRAAAERIVAAERARTQRCGPMAEAIIGHSRGGKTRKRTGSSSCHRQRAPPALAARCRARTAEEGHHRAARSASAEGR